MGKDTKKIITCDKTAEELDVDAKANFVEFNAEKLEALYRIAMVAGNGRITEAEYFDSLALICTILFDASLQGADGADDLPDNAVDFLSKAVCYRNKAKKSRKLWSEKLGVPSDGPMVEMSVAPVLEEDNLGRSCMVISANEKED